MITLRGKWRVRVTGKEASWAQRFTIKGSQTSDGSYDGIVGNLVDVDGEAPWILVIEHDDGSGAGWKESLLKIGNKVIFGTKISFDVFSEDIVDQPGGDYNDLVLNVEKIGPIFDVPIRPYALRKDNLQMMPDGIFETYLGQYFMGVKVENVWGDDFPADQLLDISQRSRNILASQGIRVVDAWEGWELESTGQKMSGRRPVVGPLKIFDSTTVYFKIDCANAKPKKYDIEFECIRPAMPDPDDAKRKCVKKIFVSRCYYDEITKEMVAECPQGKLRMKLKKVLVDRKSAKRAMKRTKKLKGPQPISTEKIKEILEALQSGKKIDFCSLMRTLKCYCECGDMDKDKPGNRGRYTFDDFFVWPLEFSYTVETNPYSGPYSPLPFDDPWWKILLLLLALVLWIASMISDAEDLAYHDDDIVIGNLARWQQSDVDAAVCLLNGNRDLPSDVPFHYLDAQTGEVSTIPLDTVDTEIALSGEILTNDEIDDYYATGDLDSLRVFKSGSRTGLTHGKIQNVNRTPFTRSDDGTVFALPQVIIIQDPTTPMPISNHGDSGSVWIHKKTRKIVALNHSGDGGGTAWASRIEDVMNALKIKFA